MNSIGIAFYSFDVCCFSTSLLWEVPRGTHDQLGQAMAVIFTLKGTKLCFMA